MSLLDARDLLRYLQRTTPAEGSLDCTQLAKLDSTVKRIQSLLDACAETSTASHRDLSQRLVDADAALRALPVVVVVAPPAEAELDELDGVVYSPLPPSLPSAPLVAPPSSLQPLSSPPALLDAASPPPRAFPAPLRARAPPPPPPPKASGSTVLSPKARATSPSAPTTTTPGIRARARPRRPTLTSPTLSDPLLPPPSSGTGNLLEHHASLQSALLGDLTAMSGQLKTNSQAFASALERDKDVVLGAQDKLDGNLTVMKKEGGRLGGYGKKASGMVWVTVALVGAVAAIWVAMFLLIKVT